MQVYLDNSATTPVHDEILEAMQPYWQQQFGNPSSPHRLGVEADQKLNHCRQYLAQLLLVEPQGLFFTSSGTEANNLAILGYCLNQRKPGHLITTNIEHPSVLRPIEYLESNFGWRVTKLKVDHRGLINLCELKEAIEPETALVSIMALNNEIGSVQPLTEISELLTAVNNTRKDHPIVFHVDACQALGKIPFQVNRDRIDLLSMSSHKIAGPKGVGLLYCRNNIKLQPLIHGGGQENGIRSGTENLPAIIGFAKAVQLTLTNVDINLDKLTTLKQKLITKLEKIPDIYFNSDLNQAPHIINLRFSGVKGEVLVHFLEQRGVYVSMGAACNSRKQSVSHVLLAIGLTEAEAANSIRISLAPDLTETAINYAADAIQEAVLEIRSIYR